MINTKYMDMINDEVDCIQIVEDMYEYVKAYASENELEQTLKALPYAELMHKGQYRKGKQNIPYIYHPLVISCQAIALGLDEDELIATALLHDVCEDCGKTKEELPVCDSVRDAVGLVTKDIDLYSKDINAESKYYAGIATNRIACIVKLLDRCNNISDMVGAFSKEKMIDYIESTLYFVYPLFEVVKREYSEDYSKITAIKYHIYSVIKNIKTLVK